MSPELIVEGHPARAEVRAPALVIRQPISFWGGVRASDGRLLDPPFDQQQRCIGGTALFIRELRGSSSASSVLLELIYRGLAPAIIILDTADAILALGAIAAREMGWPSPPIVRLSAAEQDLIADGTGIVMTSEPTLSIVAGDP